MIRIINILFLFSVLLKADIYQPEGLKENLPSVWALINAQVHIQPGEIIDNGIIIIRDGLIEDVGLNLDIPKDAVLIDLDGKIVYPGFIDGWLQISAQSMDTFDHSAHSNFKVNARRDLSRIYKPNKNDLKRLHSLGFTSAHVVPDSGVFQGKTCFVQLGDDGIIYNPSVAQKLSYEVDGWGSDRYPNSLLGVVALLRQTFIDAKWYGEAETIINKFPNNPIKRNSDLDIVNNWMQDEKPFLMHTKHELDVLRTMNLANEFDLKLWIYGNGYEYRRIDEIAINKPVIILPLEFPNTPDISNPYQELAYSTSELKHWHMGPDNPGVIVENEIPLIFTSHLLTKKEFRKNLTRSVKRNLSKVDALSALTTTPAKFMGMENKLGKIKKDYLANLTITDGDYFDNTSKVVSIWISGIEYPIKLKYENDISGKWNFQIENKRHEMHLEKKNNSYTGKILIDSHEINLEKLVVEGTFISWQMKLDSSKVNIRFVGHFINNKLEGNIPGKEILWSAIRVGQLQIKSKNEIHDRETNLEVFYPEGAYGWRKVPVKAENVIVKNTTIWTSSDLGVLSAADILFEKGKIKKIGKNLSIPKNTRIIDGRGKHLTPGLIDCHSHTASFSINEGTQSITSEVRIKDVLNSDDIDLYRQLAGGLTMANILHGSANTIGGQNAVIKLRWGQPPEKLLYKNAFEGIKFALGENVKQSNWGDDNVTRYPQTRMGVEQIIRDAFISAKEYEKEWNDYEKKSKRGRKRIPPRRNLELEAIVEILNGQRQIHCHSYRQDEIIMLSRIAEDFDFTMGTFQHVLEGYKVADILKEHGAYASTFSDWWAYKYEVIDAIPYNGAIMMDVGVNVSFNSDSEELARRMNTEAAKGVKYGNMKEEEALKLVTLNPAIQLGIEDWVGSLEVGKDADFVIWSDNPLSSRSKCEQTWIDGIQYFSLERDKVLKDRDEKIRSDLIMQILSLKNNKDKKEWKHKEHDSANHHHCNEVHE